MQDAEKPHRRRASLVVFLSLLLLCLVISIWMVSPYLLSIVMGGILSILTRPLFRWLTSHKLGRKISAGTVILAVTLLVIVPLASFATVAVRQGIELGQKLSKNGDVSLDALVDRVTDFPAVQAVGSGDPAQLKTQAKSRLRELGGKAAGVLLPILSALPTGVLQVVLALLTCFFFLIDGQRFVSWLDDKLPMDSDVRSQFYGAFKNTSVSVIWATLAAASAQASIMFVSYLVLKVPGAFLAAGATFVFAWIPIIGSTPVWLGATVYLFSQGTLGKAGLMLTFGIFTSVIDNFIRPLVLKGRGEMHPMVSLIAIFGGIQLFGLFGVFYGPILAAVLLSLLEVWPSVARRFDVIGPSSDRILAERRRVS